MKNKSGFTLIEIIIVALVIAVCGLSLIFTVTSYYQISKKKAFLNETNVVIREAENLYQSKALENNILSKVSTDDGDVSLDITNKKLSYCVHLDNAGKVSNYKISNGTYYIEHNKKNDVDIENVKFGNFTNKISCDYVLKESDLLKEEVLSIDVNSNAIKIVKLCGGGLIVLIILFFLFKSKNER